MAVPTVSRTRRGSPGKAQRISPATATLGLLLCLAGLLLLYAGRHLTFFYDEWTFALTRRGGGLGTYLDPHNGHLVLFSVLVYKLLFALVGLRHYWPYRAVDVALDLASCALLYVIVRRRLGPWLALVPTTLLLFMGTAWQDLLWPFQIAYLASVAGGLGALALIDRRDHRHDVLVSVLLIWSVFSSGVGLAFVVACAGVLIARREPWRRFWILAVPLALFAVWYLGWGSGESTTSDALLGAPQYVASAAAGAVAGITGLNQSWGPALLVALLAAMVISWRRRNDLAPAPMLGGALAGAMTFWTLAAITRADAPDPTASRYLYVGAVFVLLIGSEVWAGARLRGIAIALTGIVLLGAVVANLGLLRQAERSLRGGDVNVRAALGVVDLARSLVSPAFAPDSADAPQITAGPYLSAAHDLGSPALSLAELQRASGSVRVRSDAVLVSAERLALAPAPAAVTSAPGCRQLVAGPGSTWLELAVPAGSKLLVHATHSASVFVRRLGSEFPPAPLGTVAAGTSETLRFPSDRAAQLPWQVRLLSAGSVITCVT